MIPQEIATNWIAENGEIRPVPTCARNVGHTYPCPTLKDGLYEGKDLEWQWQVKGHNQKDWQDKSELDAKGWYSNKNHWETRQTIRLKSTPTPAIDAGERANTQQSVEEAAIKFSSDYYDEHQKVGFGTDYLNGLEVGANNGFIAGHALASSNMVELERVLGILEAFINPEISVEALNILADAITQIKNLTKG